MSVCWDGFGARWGRLWVVRRRRLACGPGGGSFSGSGVVGGGGMACAVGGGSSWFRGRCWYDCWLDGALGVGRRLGEWRGGSLFFLSCGGLGGVALSGVGVVGAGFGCALFWREGVLRGGVGMTVCLEGAGGAGRRLRVVRRRRSARGLGVPPFSGLGVGRKWDVGCASLAGGGFPGWCRYECLFGESTGRGGVVCGWSGGGDRCVVREGVRFWIGRWAEAGCWMRVVGGRGFCGVVLV